MRIVRYEFTGLFTRPEIVDCYFVFINDVLAGYYRETTIGGEPYQQMYRWDGSTFEELGAVSGPGAAADIIESDHRTRSRNRS